jgi:prepilin peptidase CpaA
VTFHFGLMGGGDVKLLAAGALWLGTPALASYLLLTVLSGGALALLFLVREGLAGRSAGARASLPYGLAIATGGIAATIAA